MDRFAILLLAVTASALDHGPTYGGSGPYKSVSGLDSQSRNEFGLLVRGRITGQPHFLPTIRISRPFLSEIARDRVGQWWLFPLYVKRNISCLPNVISDDNVVGSAFRSFLGEVASYGALAIATGPIFVDPETYVAKPFDPNDLGENPEALTAAIDWIHANAGKGDWEHIDASRIGVWGQSCGGLEAYSAGANDSRVSHLGIFNSGQLNESESSRVAGALKKPVFYLLGGSTDVAYPNGELDYANLPRGTPAWKGNHQLGHSVAFDVPNAGIPGIVGRHLLQWMLRGDARAKRWFIGDGPSNIGVDDVEYKGLKGIKVTPIQR